MTLTILCPKTGKRVYGQRNVALMEAHRLNLRAYSCGFCGYWHLTSRLADRPTWLRERARGRGGNAR